MVVMQLRSFVLVVCMLVVPALALFSHMTPPAFRQAVQHMIWAPLCETVSVINASLPFGSHAPLTKQNDIERSTFPSTRPSSLVNDSHEETSLPAVEKTRDTPPPDALPIVTVQGNNIPPRQTSERQEPRSQAEWETLAVLHDKLLSFGATKLECRPQPGTEHGYSSTCQLPMDRNGQLHRVFHGQGANAPEAMHSLIYQIQTWQGRRAGLSRKQF